MGKKNIRKSEKCEGDDCYKIGQRASDDTSCGSQQMITYDDLDLHLSDSEALSNFDEYFNQEKPKDDKVAKAIETKIMLINKIRECFGMHKIEEQPQPNEVEKLLLTSLENVILLLQQSDISIDNVRLAMIKNETERFKNERDSKKKLLSKIEKEQKEASKKFCQINKKWKEITLLNDPLEIIKATNEQRDKCIQVLERKDQIINNLKNIVNALDIFFVQNLIREEAEFKVFIEKIGDELGAISFTCEKELTQIEMVTVEKKEKLFTKQREEWNKLVENINLLELDVTRARYNTIENQMKILDGYTVESNEQMRKHKLEYLKYLRQLKQQSEEIKETNELNKNKMKYNIRLNQIKANELREYILLSQRKINSLMKKLANVKSKTLQLNKNMKKKLKKISDERNAYVHEIHEANKIADNIGKANNKKYFQLWDYNQKVVNDFIAKILWVEKNFYEKQLQSPWAWPSCVSFEKELLPSYINAEKILSEVPSHEQTRIERLKKFRKNANVEGTPENLERRNKILKYLFETIVNDCKYLSEYELEKYLEDVPEENVKTLIRIDQIFECLGIRNKKDIMFFTKYLFPKLLCHICHYKIDVRNVPIVKSKRSRDGDDNMSDISSLLEEHTVIKHLEHTALSRFENTCDVIYNEFCAEYTRPVSPKSRSEDHFNQKNVSSTTLIQGQPIGAKIQINNLRFGQNYESLPMDIHEKQTLFGLNEISRTRFPLYYKTKDDLCQALRYIAVDHKIEEPEATDDLLLPCNYADHIPLVPKIHIINSLREFVVDYYNAYEQIEQFFMDEIISKQKNTISRLLKEEDIKKYWLQYKNYFSEKRRDLWNIFRTGMSNYNKDLHKRHSLSENIRIIRKSNSELKNLLKYYIEPKKNISQHESIVNEVNKIVGIDSSLCNYK